MLWPAPALEAGFERGPWAEEAGYDDVWLPDGEGFEDPIALAAALGVATRRIRLCTGVVPVFNRATPVLATGVVAAEHRAPGRFVLGLGISTVNMIDRWYGLAFEKPLTRMRETVALLRILLRGEKSAYAGKTVRSHGFRLRELPTAPVPIHLAAMGTPMLELAGEIADGVVLNDFTTLDRLPWVLERLDAGAKRSGRRVEDLEIVHRRAIRVAETPEELRDALEYFRGVVAFYGSAPAYQQGLVALGYERAVEEIRAGYAARDRARTMRAIDDELVARIFTFGSAERCRAFLAEHFAGGIDTIAVSPQGETAESWARTAEAFTARARSGPG
jgi:alkanesulfonate monooxygenase SsuD/methylene tetrahydromethanopterin reductase-like flavin-dependent oxidoreductase (luciferase family)